MVYYHGMVKKNQACYSLKVFFAENYEFSSKLLNHLGAKTKSGTVRPKKKYSCVQVSLPTLILGPTLKMLNYF